MESYLRGELGEAETRELEEHYFACDDCFEALRDASALRSTLAKERWAVDEGFAPERRPRTWVWLTVAAAVLVGIGIALSPLLREAPDDVALDLARLATFEAPPYTPRTVRGPGGEAERRFREAMVHYQQGDYGEAIPGLETAVGLDPTSARIAFYLGACYLLTDRPEPAIERFGQVVDLGETPFLESARFSRAKAFLLTGDLEPARKELEEVLQMSGRLEGDAQRILDQLPR
jgi:tetratricopeptide (TPR) repeat protein